jgi:hypothetical protein
MPLYRGFKKGGAPPPSLPAEPTRRIARSELANRPRPPGSPVAQPSATVPTTLVHDALSSLVVGWLVVIAGPGRGQVLPLGYGVNDMGRGAGARIRLDFGDTTIASENQAAIIYTMRSRCFYLQSVVAETRLNGRPVRESIELKGGETVQIGQTCLRFAPLCGRDFDWCADHS